jgi:NAD(P)-dependent dehydrogenase (short-subunit alcohol dehydrogenase family)
MVVGGRGGIGSAVITELLAHGHKVISLDKAESPSATNPDNATDAAGVVRLHCDISQPHSVSSALGTVSRTDPAGIDALVLATGSFSTGTLAETSPSTWREVLDEHLVWPALFIAQVLPLMPTGGRIVLLSSIAATHGVERQAAYSAAKAAVISLGRSINTDFAAQNLRATVLILGAVRTGAWGANPPFHPDRMLPPSTVARAIATIVQTPLHSRIDEVVLLPPEGILR